MLLIINKLKVIDYKTKLQKYDSGKIFKAPVLHLKFIHTKFSIDSIVFQQLHQQNKKQHQNNQTTN